MKILISGTPGTGKTEVSKVLAEKLSYSLLDINSFAEKNRLITGRDFERGSKIIDEKKLREKSKEIPDDTIIEGHLAHYCRGDIAVILRTDPSALEKRLKKRGWSETKIRENTESEILDIILQESVALNKNTYEIDTTKRTPEETASVISDMIKSNSARKSHMPGSISWEKYNPNLFKTNKR